MFDCNDKWDVGAMFSENGFQHMSFVNGICTQKEENTSSISRIASQKSCQNLSPKDERRTSNQSTFAITCSFS